MYRMYYSQTDGLKMITEKFISIMRLRTPRLHVAESTVSQLVDYCLHTPTDGFRSIESVKRIITMVNHNKQYLKQ